jgi:hypothetical protein
MAGPALAAKSLHSTRAGWVPVRSDSIQTIGSVIGYTDPNQLFDQLSLVIDFKWEQST